jgi:3',5'-cyclic AMP phosphodiesterase CpdA
VRLVLTSDLHVDHHPEVVELVAQRVRRLEPEVLVVAGDVSGDAARIEETLARLRPDSARMLFVPGNHDLWMGPDGADSRARYEEILPARVRAAGGDCLGGDAVEIGGALFCGVTGWYDYSFRREDLPISLDDYERGAFGKLRWNDVGRVVWPGLPTAVEICRAQVASLERQLAAPGPKIVVTHHLPFAELVTSFSAFKDRMPEGIAELPWDFLNAFMGSARLGEAIARAGGVRLVCAGHTHFRKSLVVGGIPVEVSPVGYPREYRRAGLDLAARVEERVTLIDVDLGGGA